MLCREDKEATPWTQEAQAQATAFYLRNYLESFTQPDVSTAYASIPGVNVWDDHDIWDGFGSYDVELQQCAVFKVGTVHKEWSFPAWLCSHLPRCLSKNKIATKEPRIIIIHLSLSFSFILPLAGAV